MLHAHRLAGSLQSINNGLSDRENRYMYIRLYLCASYLSNAHGRRSMLLRQAVLWVFVLSVLFPSLLLAPVRMPKEDMRREDIEMKRAWLPRPNVRSGLPSYNYI